jgi:Tfp pilus assembly protein PilN
MYVALNISNISIRILSVKGRQVKKWGSQVLAEGLVRDGLILEPQTVGEAIDALFKSTKIPKEKVITSVSGMSFTYRFLSLPPMNPALLEEAILRAVKKEISLPPDELYLSWESIPGKEEEQVFFVLGVTRNLVDAMIQTLSVAGIEPYLMDLQPLALARAANRGDAIIAGMEPDCFDIVFVADGIPRVIHTISPRGEGATLEDNIRRLSDELTKTAAFYQSSHPDKQLSTTIPLLLTGGLAAEAATGGLLQTEVEYPIEPLTSPLETPPDLPVPTYAVNMGLALKKIPQKPPKGEASRFHDININIFSGKFRESRAKPMPTSKILLILILAIAIILLFPFYQFKSQLGAENTRLKAELREVSRELSLASLIAGETSQTEVTIQDIISSAETMRAMYQDILGARGEYTRGLVLVTNALPPATHFTSIEINNNLITVQGLTDSVFTVVSYAMALETIEAFPEVRITEIYEAAPVTAGDNETGTAQVGGSMITFEILMKKIDAEY